MISDLSVLALRRCSSPLHAVQFFPLYHILKRSYTLSMTKDEFETKLEVMRSYSFNFEGKTWQMFYEKSGGEIKIQLGEQYEPPAVFKSFRELFADAMIGSHYFKDVVSGL